MNDWIEPPAKAPAFDLSSHDGQRVRLSDLQGRTVVLYFYPKDDTPGCTREACAFRDRGAELERLGATVLGVSADDVASHRKFRDKYALNFPLLADVQHRVAESYGAWREKNLYGKKSMGIQRSTYLIDASGKVARVWKKVQVDGHDAEVLEALRTLTAGQVGPKRRAATPAKASVGLRPRSKSAATGSRAAGSKTARPGASPRRQPPKKAVAVKAKRAASARPRGAKGSTKKTSGGRRGQ